MDNVNDPTMSCYKCDGEGIVSSGTYTGYRISEVSDIPKKVCKMCNGDGAVYYIDGEKERFNLLGDRWETETMNLSSPETDHPCFVEMNKMKSKEAIVWLLERMKKEPTYLMMLLEMWIKKEDRPITKEMIGKFEELTKEWIKWGIKKKIIEEK